MEISLNFQKKVVSKNTEISVFGFFDTGISVFFGIGFLAIPVFRYLSVLGFREYRYSVSKNTGIYRFYTGIGIIPSNP